MQTREKIIEDLKNYIIADQEYVIPHIETLSKYVDIDNLVDIVYEWNEIIPPRSKGLAYLSELINSAAFASIIIIFTNEYLNPKKGYNFNYNYDLHSDGEMRFDFKSGDVSKLVQELYFIFGKSFIWDIDFFKFNDKSVSDWCAELNLKYRN